MRVLACVQANGLERIGLAKSSGGWAGPYDRVGAEPLWGPFDDRTTYIEDPVRRERERERETRI